jgi:hypothetical protein
MAGTLYFAGLVVGTALAWVSWFLIVTMIDPQSGGVIALIFFLLSLFFALLGTVASLGFLWRRWWWHEVPAFVQAGRSFRQGIIVAVVTITALILQYFRVLVVWNMLLLVVAALALELYFLSRTASKSDLKQTQNISG